jgi:hypothetical protein
MNHKIIFAILIKSVKIGVYVAVIVLNNGNVVRKKKCAAIVGVNPVENAVQAFKQTMQIKNYDGRTAARNMYLQLGEWEQKAFGLIRMSMKEI